MSQGDAGDKSRPGPEPERLKIDTDDWRDAVRRVLRKGPKKKEPGANAPPEDKPADG